MTKALVFTTDDPEAAVRIFWEEFPNTKPANVDDATALKNSVHIMKRFLEMALQDHPGSAISASSSRQNGRTRTPRSPRSAT